MTLFTLILLALTALIAGIILARQLNILELEINKVLPEDFTGASTGCNGTYTGD